MENNKKNPLLAGLFNVLVPGSVHIYIKKEWKKFILTFIIELAALGFAVWLGNQIQNVRSFNMIQGICPSILVLIVVAVLFRQGLRIATAHNMRLDNKELYQSQAYRYTEDEQMVRIQKMRDDGVISEQQYDVRKDRISQKYNEEE